MKKEAARDYVIEMFRKYAAAGYPSYEQERSRIYHDALNARAGSSGEAAVVRAETAVADHYAYLADILAVEATFRLLSDGKREIIAEAVRETYCFAPKRALHRGDITNRVNRFAATCPASESQVYRWLKYARLLCAAIRGLSISDRDLKRYHISEKVDSSATAISDIIKS